MRVPLSPLAAPPLAAAPLATAQRVRPPCATHGGHASRRSAASSLLASLLGLLGTQQLTPQAARAIEVNVDRAADQVLSNQLYGAPAPTVRTYSQQVSDAITIQTMRGVWRLSESFREPSRYDTALPLCALALSALSALIALIASSTRP